MSWKRAERFLTSSLQVPFPLPALGPTWYKAHTTFVRTLQSGLCPLHLGPKLPPLKPTREPPHAEPGGIYLLHSCFGVTLGTLKSISRKCHKGQKVGRSNRHGELLIQISRRHWVLHC